MNCTTCDGSGWVKGADLLSCVCPECGATAAARAFHEAAEKGLRANGARPSQRAVAGVIGESHTYYQRLLAGKHKVGTAKIATWIRRFADAGMGSISIVFSPDGVRGEVTL